MQRSRRRRAHSRKAKVLALLSKYKYIAIALAVIIVYVGYLYISALATVGVGPDTFYEGVRLNGVPLSGYSYKGASELMESLASDWLSQTYTVTYQGQSWSFSPASVNASLGLEEQLSRAWSIGHVGNIFTRKSAVQAVRKNGADFYSDISYDDDLMNAFIATIEADVNIEPIDAEIVCDIDQPRIITESSDGFKLDVEATKEQLNNLMLHGGGETELKVDRVRPAISSDDANGGLQVIAQCTTSLKTSTSKRLTNVKQALDYFNAVTVHNGERISFNAVVGQRTKGRGFVEAPEYVSGELQDGIGGGVCQASTTLYGALLVSGMDIIRRYPHSMTVGYTEPSFDAAVTNSSKDLVFENNSGSPIYIYTNVTKEQATVTIYGARPKYRIMLESVILVDNIEPKATRFEEDTTGKHAYYKDEYVLKNEGKMGMKSECWRIFYDWETGEEVGRKKMSTDSYEAGTTVYYVGTHPR